MNYSIQERKGYWGRIAALSVKTDNVATSYFLTHNKISSKQVFVEMHIFYFFMCS